MNILGPAPSEVKHDRQLLQMEEQQISLCLRSALSRAQYIYIYKHMHT